MHRGEVWWADLAEPRGAEPGFRRPVVVVQDDSLTESVLSTVMVVPLTSNITRARAMGNVLLSTKETGLDRNSVALTCQVVTADKEWLTELAGALPRRALRQIDAGLKLVLSLT